MKTHYWTGQVSHCPVGLGVARAMFEAMSCELPVFRYRFLDLVHISKEQNMSPLLPLTAIDGVEITTIMDNSLDLLAASTPVAKRFPVHRDLFSPRQLRAEHGVSLLITAINQGKRETILFDTGVTPDGALHNLALLGVDLGSIQAIVLSHGHTDHTQGLDGFLDTQTTPAYPAPSR